MFSRYASGKLCAARPNGDGQSGYSTPPTARNTKHRFAKASLVNGFGSRTELVKSTPASRYGVHAFLGSTSPSATDAIKNSRCGLSKGVIGAFQRVVMIW